MVTNNNPTQLNQLEFARTVGIHSPTDEVFRIRIPKIMPLINAEKGRTRLKRNIFVNASDCMVEPTNMINTQNYILAKRTANCDLSHVSQVDEAGNIFIPENTPIMCACFYSNIIYVIDAYPLPN